ncbi:MAG: nickel pincer cofactor biosynthesis protein LarC [Asgard group archaeon]|nr:nickel pincer cofactor biosynthesis protein LarC [Asgard group archaeon]
MKNLIIDAQLAGAAGDMFLGALLDLLYKDEKDQKKADLKRQKFISNIASVIPKLAGLDEKEANIAVEIIRKNAFAFEGIQLQIKIQEPHRHLMVSDAEEIINKASKHFKLSATSKEFCQTALKILFEAEAIAHGEPIEKIHLHEAGSLDTFLDLIAVSLLFDMLEIFNAKIYILPVALGSGTVTFSHGKLPVPAPAVAEIVRKYKIPTNLGTLEGELLTPTGAIIIASLLSLKQVNVVKKTPTLTFDRIGIGLGNKEFKKSPNGLRLILGNSIDEDFQSEEIAIIETNIDDCSGETIGFLTERLLELGAKDAFLTPIYMKKSRPATKISVLCKQDEVEKFANEIMNQTSTIGVRIIESSKLMLRREIREYQVTISGKKYTVRGKIAYNKHGEMVHFKPEFEDVKLITNETNLTINEVVSIVRSEIKKELEKQ